MSFLEIRNISKSFGENWAVQDFNLTVEKGELISFLGPSGCGKTTTLRIVAGFEQPTTGSVFVDGEDITNQAPNQRHIGMVFQSYALFPNMTVADNVGFGLKVNKWPQEKIKNRVAELLELIHMPDLGPRYPFQLSGGQQQRVALARALALEPALLLLDEPLSALDAKIRVSLRSEIRDIQQNLGITAIYVTHDQEEALSLSDRVVVMNVGRIDQVGPPFEIYNFPQTEFVAQFVGTLNAVQAEVIDPDNHILKIDGQQIQALSGLENAQAGDRVMIAIRPERFSFTSSGEKANILECTIENITFLGSIVRILVSIGSFSFNMDTFNNPYLELPKIGDKNKVTFSRQAVLVLNNRSVT